LVSLDQILLKKKFGQHFLNQKWVVESATKRVKLDQNSSVLEIGGGAGFLTEEILRHNPARLWVFEIDPDWVEYLQAKFASQIATGQLKVIHQDFLQSKMDIFAEGGPWTILANLPYNVSFPILHRLLQHRAYFQEGVVMVQEEVAQKILKSSGRGYGAVSLLFQHYLNWEMMDQVPPSAFNPPPKVYSRLLYFKPVVNPIAIPQEVAFWKFLKLCFNSPRRTLKNNLMQTHFDYSQVPAETLALRAQQMDLAQFLELWLILNRAA
jgi:16S rRNA (adenine1518-N6/adenine1519-N6)-dimethyltransferase